MNETKENKLLNEIIASESKDWVNKGAAPGSEDKRQKTKDKRQKIKGERQKTEDRSQKAARASCQLPVTGLKPPVASRRLPVFYIPPKTTNNASNPS